MRMLRLGSIPWIMPAIKQMQFQPKSMLHKHQTEKRLKYTKLNPDLGFNPKNERQFLPRNKP
jgi:hypothetical protein